MIKNLYQVKYTGQCEEILIEDLAKMFKGSSEFEFLVASTCPNLKMLLKYHSEKV